MHQRRLAAVPSFIRRARREMSAHGRLPYKIRDFRSGIHDTMRAFFGVDRISPIHDDADYEVRFPMPRELFQRIYDDGKDESFFQQRINATATLQAPHLQKIFGALRVLAYHEATDRADEYVRIATSSIGQAVRHLARFFVKRYHSDCLRKSTADDLRVIPAAYLLNIRILGPVAPLTGQYSRGGLN